MIKGEKVLLTIIILLMIFFPVVTAMSSSNYKIDSYVVSDGGTNTTSTNYKNDFTLGGIIGNVTSSFYKAFLGFFYVADALNNTAPNNPTPVLASTDGTNKTNADLNCSSRITDDDSGDALNVSVMWIKNNALNQTIYYNASYANATYFSALLDSANTTKGDNWTCGLRTYDGELSSSWVNSSNLTILNTLPNATLSSPANNNVTEDRTPTFTWSGSDDDNDALTYQLNLTCFPACSIDNRLESEATTSHTIINYLQYLKDNNFYYNWTVRASDDAGATYGDWATPTRKIEFQSSIEIVLVNDTVQFGALAMGSTEDTSDDNPYPFLLRNDGNAFVNVSLNATNLWNSVVNPSEYYRYKIDNKSGEEGSFNWAQSKNAWTNMPNGTYEIAIVSLNWDDATDSVEIDSLVTVPSNEGSGNRESMIVFQGELGE